MKNNTTIIIPYILGFVLIWGVAFPLYSGGGLRLFQSTSTLYLMDENKKIEEALGAGKKIAARADQEYADYSNLPQEKKALILKVIPTNFDKARTYNDLYEIGKSVGFIISNPVQSTGSKDPSESSASKSATSYTFSFQSDSSYEALKRFLAAIETNLTFYNIKGLSIQENKDPAKKGITYDLVLETYELKK